MGKKLFKYFLSKERIELGKEIEKHLDIVTHLQPYLEEPPEEIIVRVAAWCGVVVDGYYTEKELDKLCDILTRKLKEKQTIILG